jgi:hypothetical protein
MDRWVRAGVSLCRQVAGRGDREKMDVWVGMHVGRGGRAHR